MNMRLVLRINTVEESWVQAQLRAALSDSRRVYAPFAPATTRLDVTLEGGGVCHIGSPVRTLGDHLR